MMHTGSICFQWSALESLLAVVIWRLLKLDSDTGAIVTGGLDILPRINMAIALATHATMRHVSTISVPRRLSNSASKVLSLSSR